MHVCFPLFEEAHHVHCAKTKSPQSITRFAHGGRVRLYVIITGKSQRSSPPEARCAPLIIMQAMWALSCAGYFDHPFKKTVL